MLTWSSCKQSLNVAFWQYPQFCEVPHIINFNTYQKVNFLSKLECKPFAFPGTREFHVRFSSHSLKNSLVFKSLSAKMLWLSNDLSGEAFTIVSSISLYEDNVSDFYEDNVSDFSSSSKCIV